MGKLANIPGAAIAIKINAAHRAAFGNAKKAMEYAAECGRLLLEAKELVPHGEWERWLDANTEVGHRQSQKYMRLANNWEEIQAKSDSNSLLGIEAALKLLREPPEEISKYLERTGQVIESVTSPCGIPLWHRNDDGVMVNSQTLEPLPTSDDDDDPEPRKSSVALEIAGAAAKSAREAAAALRENEDALEISDELIRSCYAVSLAWDRLANRLTQKRASQRPADGRSEVGVDDCTVEK